MNLKYLLLSFCYFIVHLTMAQSSASGNVQVFDLMAPELDTTRTIRIYLPPGYQTSDDPYAVLYMHDAQNLFDTATAFIQEWGVDEYLDGPGQKKVIVVGIDHGDAQRISELTPFANEKYGGGDADAYVDFIKNTLKPHIDTTYRTFRGPEHTGIMGSSLGGLVSFYAAMKYPGTFQVVGVFSPSFWFSEQIYSFTQASALDTNQRFYFLGGTAEDQTLVSNIERMKELLLQKGLPEKNLKIEIVEGGEHNESFWGKEFPKAFKWLFPGEDLKE